MKLILFATLVVAALAEKPYAGFQLPLFSPRIVGGEDAQRGEYPFIVSLQWGVSSSSLRHFCAGSIINSQWILTAGHCVKAVPGYGVFVVKAGKHNIRLVENNEQVVSVAKSFVHESYPGGVAPYDIALLKLKTVLKLNSAVTAVGLPPSGSIPSGNVLLSGWGSISKTSISKMPDTLQKATLPVVDLNSCASALVSVIGSSSPLHETNVCTGPLTGGYSACSGDSGGPLAVKSNGQAQVIGVVSWGIIPCGTPGAPSVYTRVSAFNKWIIDTITYN